MLINVTQKDINEGKNSDCAACPIALAVKRTTNKRFVEVNTVNCHIRQFGENEEWKSYTLPSIARAFVQDFDSGNDVLPFKFSMGEI